VRYIDDGVERWVLKHQVVCAPTSTSQLLESHTELASAPGPVGVVPVDSGVEHTVLSHTELASDPSPVGVGPVDSGVARSQVTELQNDVDIVQDSDSNSVAITVVPVSEKI